jgi:hypothetical protein
MRHWKYKRIHPAGAVCKKAGISIGQYNAAMRSLPAQFTDIATQLGWRPVSVSDSAPAGRADQRPVWWRKGALLGVS